MYMKGIGQVIL